MFCNSSIPLALNELLPNSPPKRPARETRQGEIIGMRMPSDLELEQVQNALQFDDGGMRGLACALVWCGIVYHATTFKDEDLANPSMVELARSLLAPPTIYRTPGADETASMIKRIIKQNVDAKKQAVSSYEWSMILRGLVTDKNKTLTVQAAMDMYNNNPEISAHGGTGKECIPPQDLGT